ncbi:LacI family DNA-binding transcriptional regulator [Sphingomonas morindae]|uniref:LacI family DNA-binding transcriptional regulator n=1 Tax=Sphingomonas morindae TaxID=1541170 RepID=A0ABY4X4X8_9SPHN|nr:LacI family DNA-binding transcriptional regulator [Sphingomonas morindae]USI71954.1 LacI family DNA-binding transcriptional regulator [Sphingomonas morindae]
MAKKVTRRQGGAPTISDVAARAGVSAMTVSRVINGEARVRSETREAVHAAIAELRYAPNPAAQALAGASQIRIGLLYSNPSAAYLSAFLVGSLDSASRSNIQLIVEKCERDDDHEAEIARRLIEGGMDGLILPPPLCDSPAILSVLAENPVPAVAVATAREEGPVSSVGIDDFHAAEAMTRHLVDLGHRRIGIILGSPDLSASARRLEGYRAALAAAGLETSDALIAPGLFTYRSGLEAAERLLDLAEPPTAIFASNDDMAAAAVAVAHRRGLDVPGDLTVCGFDDTTIATTVWPELTTVHQPIGDMSRAAVELLLEAVRARRAGTAFPARRLLLDYALVRRKSDAAPRRPGRRRRPRA